MEPLDQPLGLRVPGPADQHLRRQGPAETLTVGGQLAALTAPPPDRALPVPHQDPRDRPEGVDQLPPAGEQVLSSPGRDQHRRRPPRVPGHHRQHRQRRRRAGLPEPDRHLDVGEPEVTLGDLARYVARSRGRVRRQIHRPQLADPSAECPDRVRPTDPLSDHRRRHRGIRLEQLPDPRLKPIDQRPRRLPPILRRALAVQRRLDRVPRQTHDPRDL